MSTISEQSKFKSYNFWVKMVSAVVLILRIVLNKFGYELDSAFVLDIATLVAGVLVILGIINEPTGVTVSFNENVEGDGVEGNSSEVLKEKVKEKLSEVESIFTSFGASDKSAIKKRLDDIDNFIVGILDGEENSINSLNALINGNGGKNLNADRENGECVEEQIEKVAQSELENATEEGLETLSTTEEGLEALSTTEEGLEAFNLSEAKESGCEIEVQNDELGEQIKEVEVQGELNSAPSDKSEVQVEEIINLSRADDENLVESTANEENRNEESGAVEVQGEGIANCNNMAEEFDDGNKANSNLEINQIQGVDEGQTEGLVCQNEGQTEVVVCQNEGQTEGLECQNEGRTEGVECQNEGQTEVGVCKNGVVELPADKTNEQVFADGEQNATSQKQAELCSSIGKTNQVDATIATDEQNIETPHFTALDVVKCIEDQLCGEDAEQKSKFAEKLKDIILSNIDELVG